MNKRLWDLYAPIYERAMRSDERIYEYMYRRIPQVVGGMEVLEIAAGPGLLARHIAPAAKSVTATDYSEGMIAQAKKGPCPENLHFEAADAMALPYPDGSFDAVIIANALHILPEPEKALSEIRRVLRADGILIASNFVEHRGSFMSRLWSGILQLAGVRFAHQWSAAEYITFLEKQGWKVTYKRKLKARIAMVYAECEDSGECP
ncbi:MAG: class I SAM-dependent methyltransferase [Clostridium sp.]|nr:class I SAM-dependent methyltransferase [Clostridium sp.]